MTRLAQLLLVLTSLAPIGFVHAAVLFERGRHIDAIGFGVASLLLAVVCHLLLYGIRRYCSDVPKETTELTTKESEPLAFLVAYALPLVSAKAGEANVWGLVAFAIVMALAIWQQQVFHINPLLAILGYHFFGAKDDGGAPVTIIARTRSLPAGSIHVIRISDSLWLYWSGLRRKA
jgi:hypothetical protein